MEPLTIVIPNHKADMVLGGNSRASWQVKYRRLKADKNDAAIMLANYLNRMGMTALEYLTNFGQYEIEDCLPVRLTFKRLYTGKAQQWDDGNLYSAYKGFTDGVSKSIGIDDRYFKTNIEQIRGDFDELEIEISPAWYLKGLKDEQKN